MYHNYGIDWNEPVAEIEPNMVEVPETSCGLPAAQVEEIKRLIPGDMTLPNSLVVFQHILNRTLNFQQ